MDAALQERQDFGSLVRDKTSATTPRGRAFLDALGEHPDGLFVGVELTPKDIIAEQERGQAEYGVLLWEVFINDDHDSLTRCIELLTDGKTFPTADAGRFKDYIRGDLERLCRFEMKDEVASLRDERIREWGRHGCPVVHSGDVQFDGDARRSYEEISDSLKKVRELKHLVERHGYLYKHLAATRTYLTDEIDNLAKAREHVRQLAETPSPAPKKSS